MNVFYQDKRIAHTPFHALTPAEREIYIARTNLLNHMATLLREEVQRREAVLRVEGGDSGGKKPKILFKYCYECGRSAGKLCPCTRCYTVSFCSQRCKLKAWTSRHRRECIKLENKRQDKPVKTVPVKETKSKTDSKPDKPVPKKASISKDIFGRPLKGKNPTQEVINLSLPRQITLQHSQL